MLSYSHLDPLFLYSYGDHRDLHSFPTRRSSDLGVWFFNRTDNGDVAPRSIISGPKTGLGVVRGTRKVIFSPDRKSTRLNSSHRCISYAVFCLKKKNKS